MISDVTDYVSKTDIRKLNHILINTGVNDIDNKSAEEIAEEFKNIIQLLKNKYIGIKIIISEITPRKDGKDKDVIECNRILADICNGDENVFLISHENLRDSSYSKLYDTKHIHYRAIGLFVSNIKQTLRKAYGIIYDRTKVQQRKHNSKPNHYINLRDSLRKLPPMQRRRLLGDIQSN